jgi:hypothetical protein
MSDKQSSPAAALAKYTSHRTACLANKSHGDIIYHRSLLRSNQAKAEQLIYSCFIHTAMSDKHKVNSPAIAPSVWPMKVVG